VNVKEDYSVVTRNASATAAFIDNFKRSMALVLKISISRISDVVISQGGVYNLLAVGTKVSFSVEPCSANCATEPTQSALVVGPLASGSSLAEEIKKTGETLSIDPTSVVVTEVAPSAPANPRDDTSRGGMSLAVIVGIVVGVVALAVTIFVVNRYRACCAAKCRGGTSTSMESMVSTDASRDDTFVQLHTL